jgi:fatty acid desaturase
MKYNLILKGVIFLGYIWALSSVFNMKIVEAKKTNHSNQKAIEKTCNVFFILQSISTLVFLLITLFIMFLLFHYCKLSGTSCFTVFWLGIVLPYIILYKHITKNKSKEWLANFALYSNRKYSTDNILNINKKLTIFALFIGIIIFIVDLAIPVINNFK